VIKSQV
jgi:hypothetical protein